MGIALSVISVAFAAVCVWLTVRIVNRRKKPGKAFLATAVVLILLVGYPLSFVPAIHLYAHGIMPFNAVVVIYRPIRGALHAFVRNPTRCRFVTLGSDRVAVAIEQTVAWMYGPATD